LTTSPAPIARERRRGRCSAQLNEPRGRCSSRCLHGVHHARVERIADHNDERTADSASRWRRSQARSETKAVSRWKRCSRGLVQVPDALTVGSLAILLMAEDVATRVGCAEVMKMKAKRPVDKLQRRPPGKTAFRQAANFIGGLIFERGLLGDLDMAVSCRRMGDATTISVVYPDGVASFVVTDEKRERELTPRQREALRLRRQGEA